MWTRNGARCLAALLLVLVAPVTAGAQANDPQVIVVPYAPDDPAVPFPAHEGAQITLKGILRNANCAQGYRVRWDANRNGVYDDDVARVVQPTGGTVYDIGRTFQVPSVDGDTSLPINVRVDNLCDGQSAFATFRLFVYDFAPTPDPGEWSSEQIETMSQMALHEALWYIHRGVTGRNGAGAQIQGYLGVGGNSVAGSALAVWALVINGRLPAYPPGTIDAFGQALPNGFIAANDARWARDPYSETGIRLVNWLLARGTATVAINAQDEDDRCRLDGNGGEQRCQRLPGSTDGRGAYTGGVGNDTYYMGIMVGSIAPVLPALAGTHLQVGGLRGTLWEVFVQQLTDYLAYMQIDGDAGSGGWYYNAIDGAASGSYMDGSTAQWGYIGLESAAVAGAPYGVIVSNRHKYRIADNLIRNQGPSGGASYRNDGGWGTDNIQLTGGAFVAARWLGMHELNADDHDSRPFRPYSNRTAAELRRSFNRTLAFTAARWNRDDQGYEWWGRFRMFAGGSYLCGNTNAVYKWGNAAECGNLYAIYSHQKGYRTGSREQGLIGETDWTREFNVFVMRAQDRNIGDYGNFGRVSDCGNAQSIACSAGNAFSTPVGALVLTPSIFDPKPVAIGQGRPTAVVEGCAGGNNGRVDFTHNQSFHLNPRARIIAYRWDVDASNGLWWETNAPQDFVSPDRDAVFAYRYQRRGNYTATLQVVDDHNNTKSTTARIAVDRAPNSAPSAAHGGPYAIEVGEDLPLRGTASDPNAGCGDQLTVGWDIDNDGQYDDAAEATVVVPWARIQALNLVQGRPYNITLKVSDQAGDEAVATTQLTVYAREPVAAATVTPNPARCQQDVTFDASQSRHPNPARSITQYQWNVDGQAGFDGGGANPVFTFRYGRYGTYDAVLQITDDRGRVDTENLRVVVDQGNSAPVARVAQAEIGMVEGADLRIDASASTDPNQVCGDRIARYEVDVNGDGDFDDAGVDVSGPNPIAVVPWATVQGALRWPADPSTRLPDNTVTVRITDTFGGQSTTAVKVAIFGSRPEARIVQSPNPAAISLQTGRSDVNLDARESRSPLPGGRIARYQWDTDDDGVFGDAPEEPTVVVRKIFNPIPREGQIPDVFVRLRVTDGTGQTAELRQRIAYDVPPVPPTADADPTDPPERGYHVLLGDDLSLSAVQSFDPDTAEFDDFIAVYRWDLDDDGDWDLELDDADRDGEEAITVVPAAELAQYGMAGVGTYGIRLEVEDSLGLTNQDVSFVRFYPRAPVAAAVAVPNPGGCGQLITLDASASDHAHPGVDIVSWAWDFDADGQYDDAQGRVTTITPDQFGFGGPLAIGLRVTDSAGGTAANVVSLRVDQGNSAPAADPGGPYVIALGDGLTLDGRNTSEPDAACGDRVVRYEWLIDDDDVADFESVGDPRQAVTAQQLAALGVDRIGRFQVRLRATDRFGVRAIKAAHLDLVNGPTAVAELTPARVGCNVVVEFDGRGSFSDGPADQGFGIVRYEWDLGNDGTIDAVGPTLNQNAAARGRVVARLIVTDAGGRTDEAVVELDIVSNNVPPVADAGGPYNTGPAPAGGFAGVTLDGRGSTDPNAPCDQVARWDWDTDGDGRYGADDADGAGDLAGTDYTGAVVRDYRNPGWRVGITQIVRLRVCDGEGACSPGGEAEINVLDRAPPTGEILAPRAAAGACVAGGPFDVRMRIADPDGDVVHATLMIDGEPVAELDVDTPNDGSAVERTIALNAADVPEGRREISILLTDPTGADAVADAGGRIPFDRSGPDVSIGNNLLDGVCYDAAEVPQPEITVRDNLDEAPVVRRDTVSNACQRVLNVTATDACGNVSSATRTYRIATPVDVEIQGPAEDQLVTSARLNWRVVGPADCANQITARLSQDGVADRVYEANSLVEEPGTYTMNLTVPDCLGNERRTLRAFRVNGPPEAVPVPAGHPAAAVGELLPAYRVAEGTPLEIDGGGSRPPEAGDAIALYEWDLDDDGEFEVEGQRVRFDTDEDGDFRGRLRVTDALGAVGVADFLVIVDDVRPAVNAGGPYTVRQGEALRFDGSATRPGSPADAITRYTWQFGDGTPDADGPDVVAPVHTYADHGVYNARLTVRDEDGASVGAVQVTVRDVDPNIRGVTVSQDPFEVVSVRFSADAVAGAPRDPIIAYEWDFEGDAQPELVLPGPDAQYRFKAAGRYNVTLRVRDPDSVAQRQLVVDVREITLSDLLRVAAERAAAITADARATAEVKRILDPQGSPAFAEWAARGLWAERHGAAYRGNTLMALDELVFRVYRAQVAGSEGFGDLLWAMSRQLLREVDRQRNAVGAVVGLRHPAVVRADRSLAAARAIFDGPDFEARVAGDHDAFLARDLFAAVVDAYFSLRDAVDPANQADGFPMPDLIDPVQRVNAANDVNGELAASLGILAEEMQAYLDQGEATNDLGPGRDAVADALAALQPIRALVAKRVGLVCDAGNPCIDDRESMDLQLRLMDLVGAMFAAADEGVYVRNWQNVLTLGIKFRAELALLRIEFVCGPNTAVARAGRAQQDILLDLVDAGQNDAALFFYISPERRCLVVREYNECIVTTLPDENDAVEYPAFCAEGGGGGEDGDDGGDDGGDGGDGEVPPPVRQADARIPLREPFVSILVLSDVIRAFVLDIDVGDPAVRAARYPGRTLADFDREGDGDFDLFDVQRAIQQFVHDPYDLDGDGLIGIIENDCRLRAGAPNLQPDDPTTEPGRNDAFQDCDGDLIANGREVELDMNPLDPRDAHLDFDGDDISNLAEVRWDLDPNDHRDGIGDLDGDGLTNHDEIVHGLNPRNAADRDGDFDRDGLVNGVEVRWGLDPFDAGDADLDPDGDGMSSRNEIARGRDPLRPDCNDDPAELAGRNDGPGEATPLGDANRIDVADGRLCNTDPDDPDEDWYRFDVNEADARVVVTLRFDAAQGDLDLRLFDGVTGVQLADSSTRYETELIAQPRGQVPVGPYLVRVSSPRGSQIPYRLTVTVVPPVRPCTPDFQEGADGNDNMQSAVALGAREVRMGDAWVCAAERRTGDWFRIDVGNRDRTIHLSYARNSDGQLQLAAMTQDLRAFVESVEVQTAVQCINVRANGNNTPVYLNVAASTVFSDGDDRVDYVLQVVDTDLNANPRGACDLLSAGLFDFVSWPTLRP